MGCGSSVPVAEIEPAPKNLPNPPVSWKLDDVLREISDKTQTVRSGARDRFNQWTSSEQRFTEFLESEGADKVLNAFIAAVKRDGTDHAVRLKLLALISSHATEFSRYWDSSITASLVSGVLSFATQYPEDIFVFAADILYVLLQSSTAASAKSVKSWLSSAGIWPALTHAFRNAQGKPKACVAALNLARSIIEGDSEQVKNGLLKSGSAAAAIGLLSNCIAVSARQATSALPASDSSDNTGMGEADVLLLSPAPAVLHLLHTAVRCSPGCIPLLAKAEPLSSLVELITTCCSTPSEGTGQAQGALAESAADMVLSAGTLLLAFARGRAASVSNPAPSSSKAVEAARAADRDTTRNALVQAGATRACLALLQMRGDVSHATMAQQLAATVLESLALDGGDDHEDPEDESQAAPMTVNAAWLEPALPGGPEPPKLPANGSPGLRAVLDPGAGLSGTSSGVAGAVWHSLLLASKFETHPHALSHQRAEAALCAVALLSRAASSRDGIRRLMRALHAHSNGDGIASEQGPHAEFDMVLAQLYLSSDPCSASGAPTASTPVRRRLGPLLWLLASERARFTAERWARRRALWRRFHARQLLLNEDAEDEPEPTVKAGAPDLASPPRPQPALPPTGPARVAKAPQPPHKRFDWGGSGAWEQYFTTTGLPYFLHKDSGLVQWAEPTSELPDAGTGNGDENGPLDLSAPAEDDREGLIIFHTLWHAGYYKTPGEGAESSKDSGKAAASPSGSVVRRMFGMSAKNEGTDRSWRADDLVLRLCLCAVACEALCDAPYMHPAGEPKLAGTVSKDGLARELAEDESHHWPHLAAIGAGSPLKDVPVAAVLAYIRACTSSLEAARRSGFSLGNILHPTAPAVVVGSASGAFASSAPSDDRTSAPAPTPSGMPFPFLFTPEHLASISRLARCDGHAEVAAFAAWVIREAVGSAGTGAGGEAQVRDWKDIESRLAAIAPAGAVPFTAEHEGSESSVGSAMQTGPFGAYSHDALLQPFGWPMHGLPAHPAVPRFSPILAAVAGLQDFDASIAAIGGQSLGRDGTAVIMSALQQQRFQVMQTLLLQQRAVAAAAAVSAPYANVSASSVTGPVSDGLVYSSPLSKNKKKAAALGVAVLINIVPAEDVDFRPFVSPKNAAPAAYGPGSLLSLFNLSWLPVSSAAALLGPVPGPVNHKGGADGTSPRHGHTSAGRGPAQALLTGTLWQFPWVEAVGSMTARDDLEACGAKVGLRTSHFFFKQDVQSAGAPSSTSIKEEEVSKEKEPKVEASASRPGMLERLFGSVSSSTPTKPTQDSSNGSVESNSVEAVAPEPVAKTTLEVEKEVSALDAAGRWPLAPALIHDALLALTFLPDEAPAAASNVAMSSIAIVSAKDAFMRLRNKRATERATAIAAKMKEAAEGSADAPSEQ